MHKNLYPTKKKDFLQMDFMQFSEIYTSEPEEMK